MMAVKKILASKVKLLQEDKNQFQDEYSENLADGDKLFVGHPLGGKAAQQGAHIVWTLGFQVFLIFLSKSEVFQNCFEQNLCKNLCLLAF